MELQELLTNLWWAVLFSVGVYVSVRILRIAERGLPKHVRSHWAYHAMFLPLLPAVLGGVYALSFFSYPFPEEIRSIPLARMMLGISMGFFSSWAVRVLSERVKQLSGVSMGTSEHPPPGETP
jgi:hypothetical protein